MESSTGWRFWLGVSALFVVLWGVLAALIPSKTAQDVRVGPLPARRPFRMGFSYWPADISIEGIKMAEDFANAHGDVVSALFIGGIPWPEALAGRPYSPDVIGNFTHPRPPGMKLMLYVSPLNQDRSGLAPYWGVKDNQPLPVEWRDLHFDDPRVETAFAKFVSDAVAAMRPDWLCIGVEANALLSKRPEEWPRFKKFYRNVRARLKSAHPALPIFFSTEVNHYLGYATEAKGKDQKGEVADLMKDSDLFAMSFYPFMTYDGPKPFRGEQLAFARSFGKPIAVAESGMTSEDVNLPTFGVTLRGSPQDQADFTNELLKEATIDRYAFVINWATTDFGALCDKLPDKAAEIARIWAYTGLQDGKGRPKPAFRVWDGYFNVPFGR